MSWEPAPGVMLGGKYRLERALASGGMGSVWLARHTRLEADVAVKLMSRTIGTDRSSVARFEREAKACAQLSSPHVVGVHDFGVEDGTPYMVMELLRGEDLGSRIDRVGRMTLAEAIGIAVPIGKALRLAHDAGLIHRDLKPRNIFLARHGDEEVVKLVDFGIARETKSKLVDDKTDSGVVVGSPYHMSPEQALAHPVDHRSDLWSLGVVLYRLVTGVRPFGEGDSVTSVLLTICMEPHAAPTSLRPELPPEVDAFFAKALAKDPAKRFQTAREMSDAFVALSGESRPDDSNKIVVPAPAPSSPTSPSVSFSTDALRASSESGLDGQTPPVLDASASQALRAVSSRSFTRADSPRSGRVVVAAGLAVLLAAGVGVLFVRPGPPPGGQEAAAASPAPSSSPAAPVVAEATPSPTARPEVAPNAPREPTASDAPAPTTSAAGSAAARTRTPEAAPLRGGRAPSQPAPATAAPPPEAPATDPFYGLPVTR